MGVPLVPAGSAVSQICQTKRDQATLWQWLTREKAWIADTHLQVCRIPSQTFLEQKRAEWMLQQFRAFRVGVADRSRRET